MDLTSPPAGVRALVRAVRSELAEGIELADVWSRASTRYPDLALSQQLAVAEHVVAALVADGSAVLLAGGRGEALPVADAAAAAGRWRAWLPRTSAAVAGDSALLVRPEDPRAVPVRATGSAPREPTRFSGISTAPGRGITEPSGLYEFFTEGDEHINLHDADCRSIAYTPGPQPTLTLVFEYDADWVPPELVGRPFFVFICRDAEVVSWETDEDELEVSADHPEAPGGQAGHFGYDGHRTFWLTLLHLELTFTASVVEVTTAAAAPTA